MSPTTASPEASPDVHASAQAGGAGSKRVVLEVLGIFTRGRLKRGERTRARGGESGGRSLGAKARTVKIGATHPPFSYLALVVMTITPAMITALATNIRAEIGSPAIAQPRNTATTGFT
jgi:hypothetical protein